MVEKADKKIEFWLSRVDSSERFDLCPRLMRTQFWRLVTGWKVLRLSESMSDFGAGEEKEKRGGEEKEEEDMPISRPESCVGKASVDASVCIEPTWCV